MISGAAFARAYCGKEGYGRNQEKASKCVGENSSRLRMSSLVEIKSNNENMLKCHK